MDLRRERKLSIGKSDTTNGVVLCISAFQLLFSAEQLIRYATRYHTKILIYIFIYIGADGIVITGLTT